MTLKAGTSLVRKFVWAGGIFVALVVAIHLLLPLVMNTAAMRSRILSRVAQQIPGAVNFGRIKPTLLPRPSALVTEIRFSQADKFNLQCSKAVIYPRLLPLLAGRLTIDHLTVLRPDIAFFLTEPSSVNQGSPQQSIQAVESRIRAAVTAVFESLGLPAIRIKAGRLVLKRPGAADIAFSRVNLRAEVNGQRLEMLVTGHSNLLETFKLQERIDLPSLDGSGRLHITGLDTASLAADIPTAAPAWLPAMVLDLEVAFQNRALASFQSEVLAKASHILAGNGSRRLSVNGFLFNAGVRWTAERLRVTHFRLQTGAPAVDLSGAAVWSLSDRTVLLPAELRLETADLDIGPIRSVAMQLTGGGRQVQAIFDIIRNGRVSDLSVTLDRPKSGDRDAGIRLGLKGRLTDGLIVLPHSKLHLEAVKGEFELKKGRLSAGRVSARSGRIMARYGSLALGLMDDTRAFLLDTEIDADMSQVVPMIEKFAGGQELLDLLEKIPEINGRARGRLRLGDTLDHISGGITADGHLDVLDAALDVSAASVAWTPSAMTGVQADLSGSLGSRSLEWLRQRGAVPDAFLLKAPLAVSHTHLSWKAPDVLGVQGEFITDSGLSISTALTISGDELDLSRLRLKDSVSDGVISIHHHRTSSRWQIGFSGRLDGSTASSLLRSDNIISGWLAGDVQADFKSDSPLSTEIRGHLDCRRINMPQSSSPALSIIDATVVGQGSRIDIATAGLNWQQSTARLSGSATFTPAALELDLAVNADTLDVDKVMTSINAQKPTGAGPALIGDHALPVRGRIRALADQLFFGGGYRFSPVQAVITLQDESSEAVISVANFCGISIPGQIRYEPDGLRMMFNVNASRAMLRDTDRCLGGISITERLEGTVSADGSFQTHGRTGEELTRNLAGQLKIEISDGRVFNIGAAGFFTNLLSFISVNQLIQGKLPDLRKNDFQYNSLSSKLTLKDGRLRIEEGVLKSNAVNIVGHGDYVPASRKLDLVLLVSPLTTVDWIIKRIPLIGHILQGTLVAVPVGVKGPVANPRVIPLAPSAVGSRLGGILERTIKTPFRILSPLLKDKSESNP